VNLALTQLAVIMPSLQRESAVLYLPHLNDAMAEADINTPQRVAAFIAQLAHESNELRSWVEQPHKDPAKHPDCRLCRSTRKGHVAGAQYENRAILGNDRPGDGIRYLGRGPIQLTGRANYRDAGLALGLPLEDFPDRVATADVGFRVACWYWTSRHCNEPADAGDFDTVTRRINGGLNGKPERDRYHHIARNVLGVHPDAGGST
jgi:predicted chitinase